MDTTRDGSTGEPSPVDLALANAWPAAMFVGHVTIAIGVIVVAWPDGTD